MTEPTTNPNDEPQVRELTPDEIGQVSGGRGGVNVLMADGSVRGVQAGDLALWQQNYGAGY